MAGNCMKSPMKVVLINSVYKKGSTGRIVSEIHNFCKGNKIDSYVCYGRGNKINEKNIYRVSNNFLSKINQIRAKLTGIVYGGNYLSTLKLILIIKKIKPNIVHIHNLNDQYVNEYLFLKFLAKSDIKTIITLHSEQMYTGTCGYSIGCNSWKEKGCSFCPHIKISTGSKIDKTKKAFKKLKKTYELFKRENLVFTSCTPWLQDRALSSIMCKNFKNVVILNGGNSNIYKNLKKEEVVLCKKNYGLSLEKKIVLNVNPRISDPIKGYYLFEKMSKKFLREYQVVIVGKLSENTKKIDGITYLGEVNDQNELAKIYNCADYTIMLSQRECFPMVIVESLLCGTPVSLFECGGPDKCFDNKYVKFTNYGKIDELFGKLPLFDCSKEEVRKYSEQHLSNINMCSKYINLYRKALKL